MGRGKMGMQKRTWIDFLFLSFLMSFVWLNGYESIEPELVLLE